MDPREDNSEITNPSEPIVYTPPYQRLPERWYSYFEFAHGFDGYLAFPDNLGEIANKVSSDWYENQILPEDPQVLRSCLFYEARRSRFVDGFPQESDMGYLDALFEKINANLGVI